MGKRQRQDLWFKFYPDDWLDKTRDMTLEQRGAYIDSIALQMKHEAPLRLESDPDEKYGWLAHKMHISRRKAKAIVEQLIEARALRQTDAGLVNDRCLEEIAEKQEQRRLASETAMKREQTKAGSSSSQSRTDAHSTPVRDRSNIEPTSTQSRVNADPTLNQTRLDAEKNKKPNHFNVNAGRCLPDGEHYAGGRPHTIEGEGEGEGEKVLPKPSLTLGQKGSPAGAPVGGGQGVRAQSDAKAPSAKGSRLPPDWELPLDWRAWALEHHACTPQQLQREADTFADYWHGKAGADARKADWQATFRNWIRRKFPAKTEPRAPIATPLPAEWELPEEWRRWTLENFKIDNRQCQSEADAFADWYHSRVGSEALKGDWQATWRSWIRRKHQPRPTLPSITSAEMQIGDDNWWTVERLVQAMTHDRWRELIARWANGRWPVARLGPAPGDDGCVVPTSIIRELRLTDKYDRHGYSRTPHH